MADLVSGKKYELVLKQGTEKQGDYSESTLKGKVRSFEQVERIYDKDGIAVDKTIEVHWEMLTDDPIYPAVGFLPENVVSAKPV